MNVAYNMDCMEYMKTLPDKYFDLAVVDPPYGLERFKHGGSHINKYGDEKSNGTIQNQHKNILNSFLEFQNTKLFGGQTTFSCQHLNILLFGTK